MNDGHRVILGGMVNKEEDNEDKNWYMVYMILRTLALHGGQLMLLILQHSMSYKWAISSGWKTEELKSPISCSI